MPDEIESPAVASEPIKRNYFGWMLLSAIFGLLILMQGISYFGRVPSEPLRAMEIRLKTAVTVTSGIDSGGSQLSAVIRSLNTLRETDDNAERLWIIATYEQSRVVPEADIKRLRASSLEDGEVLAAIYSKAKLNPPQAKTLTTTLGHDSRFSTRLAKIHALEKADLPGGRYGLGGGSLVAAGVLGLLGLVGFGLWIGFAVLKFSRNLPAEGHPSEPLTLPQADAFAMRAAQLMAVFVVVPIVVSLAIPKRDGDSRSALFGFVAQLAVLVAAWWLATQKVDGERISLKRLGFSTQRPLRDILLGLCATAMNYPVIMLLGLVGNWLFRGLPEAEHPIQVELSNHPSAIVLIGLAFTACLAAPIFEEMIFRGALLPAVSRVRNSPAWGVAITSVLFATIHPTGIPQWPGLAAIGAMGCLLAYQTKSLVPSIVMHGMNNAISLVVTVSLGS